MTKENHALQNVPRQQRLRPLRKNLRLRLQRLQGPHGNGQRNENIATTNCTGTNTDSGLCLVHGHGDNQRG